MGKAEIWALPSISYASQIKHPNAQDYSGLENLLKTCQRKLMIVQTQFGTLVLPSEWKTELSAECRNAGIITIKSSLVPLIEGLCAQIYFRFEISVVFSHLLLFFFVKEKTC